MSPSPDPSPIGTVSATHKAYESVDHIAFSCIALSCATKQAYVLSSVIEFETSKSDDGDAGVFSLVFPMAQTYEGAPNPAPEYAKIAAPMDVIAIYALRLVSKEPVVAGAPTSVPQVAPTGATWGAAGCIDALITAGGGTTASEFSAGAELANGTCLFIGIVDEVRVKVSTGGQPQAHLLLEGHDLTKIFLCNDAALPLYMATAIGYNLEESVAPLLFLPQNGVQLLEESLDYMVSRKAPPGTPQGNQVPTALQAYSFPWRNFISRAKIDPSFDAFVAAEPISGTPVGSELKGINLPAYRIQDATAWANMTDLRNSPINRLFVDEFGYLIFDDSYNAWLNVGGVNDSIYTITEPEVLDYDFWLSDTELVTMLSVWTINMMASGSQAQTQYILKGDKLDQRLPSATPTTMSTPTAMHPDDIQRYGVRYGQYVSNWDITLDDAVKRWKYLTVNHDSIYFAHVTVRGRSVYRVGKRVVLGVPAHRKEFSDATWYITAVSHTGQFGSGWTTSLQLRYAMFGAKLTQT
jgi:hypothetical protein